MAEITLMGRSFEIAPLKLGDLRKVAKHIDAINATAGALTTFEGMVESSRSMIEVLAVAVQKIDATLTADAIEEATELADIPVIGEAFKILLQESGLAPKGEAPAPSEPVTEGASTTNSDASSAS
jgi:hypothetical protein